MARVHPRRRGEQAAPVQDRVIRLGSPPQARGAGLLSLPKTKPPGVHPRRRGEQSDALFLMSSSRGSPPQARGAGRVRSRTFRGRRVHPRRRGEQDAGFSLGEIARGSPPQARGAAGATSLVRIVRGFTPAGAGSSAAVAAYLVIFGVHPRRRGEQLSQYMETSDGKGSPPQARGAAAHGVQPGFAPGFTPAGAGSSAWCPWPEAAWRVHPRRRGEQVMAKTITPVTKGSPPQARGAVDGAEPSVSEFGFTPAGAGSRVHSGAPSMASRVHPRRRGEQVEVAAKRRSGEGSPPQARGADPCGLDWDVHVGFTPAGAGSSGRFRATRPGVRVHPRRRGEQISRGVGYVRDSGSPPQARGADWLTWHSRAVTSSLGALHESRTIHPKGLSARWGWLPRTIR